VLEVIAMFHRLCLSFLSVTVVTLLGMGASAPAQPPGAARQPRTATQSPEIGADRRVTFRLRAAKAEEVVVAGQWGGEPVPMVKGESDVWSITVGPIEPGVWEYSFRVDGLQMIDPGNPAIKPMREPRTSILHIPGVPPLLHDFQEVPHGVVHSHSYFSKSLNRLRELTVYTPPGYERQADARFPTLYLQHGSGDNQATWVVHGKAHWILDNLIARGKAQPMVVVMMDGHAGDRSAGGPQGNTGAFERDLLQDVMPFVEANYRVKSEASGPTAGPARTARRSGED